MLKIKLMYKIHGLNTSQGMSRSAGNDTFYETEEEALEMARSYVARPGGNDSMVIYKAHVLICPSHPPVEIRAITHSGEVVPMEMQGLF